MRTKDLEAMAKAYAEVQEKARQEAAQRQAEYYHDKGSKADIVMDPKKKKKDDKETETEVSTQESTKFMIPEEIPANERTAFHGAAAGAAKAGKSHFMFKGKKYPATMQKDTAQAITSDTQKESKDLDTANADKALKHDCATHVEHTDHGKGVCIPGMHTIEESAEGEGYVTHYDVMFDGQDGPFIVENVSVQELKVTRSEMHTHSKKKMKEAADHGNMDNGSPRGEGLSPSAKKELARKTEAPAAVDIDKVLDMDFKTFKAMGKKSKSRPGDNAKGDNNIIKSATPVKGQ